MNSTASDTTGIAPEIQKLAPVILAEIQTAKSILLHCHPSPDPDSVGSALAMKFALEGMGKKATVIRGDSPIPEAFMHFPGATTISMKGFAEINHADFDLFISLDCSSPDRISAEYASFAQNLPFKVINIDHHASNVNFGSINLVERTLPATAQILYELFTVWNVTFTREISGNLFIGMYTDTGGFRHTGTTVSTFMAASRLAAVATDFPDLISRMYNSNTPATLAFQGAALSNIETFLDGRLALSSVSHAVLKQKNITPADMGGVQISTILRSVKGWNIDVEMVELAPGLIKMSLRSQDEKQFDVSQLALAFGGGGHKVASGATIKGLSLDEAKKQVVAKAKELYTL